mmetsp:Transcript_44693/g.141806  ORF Transcript_44693/g.141806 Transcript_44693/m.141806 type:complete len:202 (+) Transcript_44693:397-1002(+)
MMITPERRRRRRLRVARPVELGRVRVDPSRPGEAEERLRLRLPRLCLRGGLRRLVLHCAAGWLGGGRRGRRRRRGRPERREGLEVVLVGRDEGPLLRRRLPLRRPLVARGDPLLRVGASLDGVARVHRFVYAEVDAAALGAAPGEEHRLEDGSVRRADGPLGAVVGLGGDEEEEPPQRGGARLDQHRPLRLCRGDEEAVLC